MKKGTTGPAAPGSAASASRLIDARIAELRDWRGDTLARVRRLIRAAVPEVVEEWKWDVPVWSSLDPARALLAALSMLALLRFHIGMLWVLGGAALAGIALRLIA